MAWRQHDTIRDPKPVAVIMRFHPTVQSQKKGRHTRTKLFFTLSRKPKPLVVFADIAYSPFQYQVFSACKGRTVMSPASHTVLDGASLLPRTEAALLALQCVILSSPRAQRRTRGALTRDRPCRGISAVNDVGPTRTEVLGREDEQRASPTKLANDTRPEVCEGPEGRGEHVSSREATQELSPVKRNAPPLQASPDARRSEITWLGPEWSLQRTRRLTPLEAESVANTQPRATPAPGTPRDCSAVEAAGRRPTFLPPTDRYKNVHVFAAHELPHTGPDANSKLLVDQTVRCVTHFEAVKSASKCGL